jgi:predicted porin
MKKSLVALAVLAAAGAASAQSSVTLWGVVDAGVGSYKANSVSRTAMGTSLLSSSQLGFRGTEDLGGGLRAGFWLEAGINPDSGIGQNSNTNNQASGAGSANALTFNRRSTLELNGSFGTVRLGRDYTPNFWNKTVFDPFGTLGVAQSSNLNLSGLGVTSVRASNGISYLWNVSPNAQSHSLGSKGVYAQATYALGENASNATVAGLNTSKDGGYSGIRVGYQQGPLNAALAIGSTKVAAVNDHKEMSIGASYDLGMAKLIANYSNNKSGNDAVNNKTYLLGATIPLGAGYIPVSYNNYKSTGSASNGLKASQLGIGYVYNLSKRTAVYTTFAQISNSGGASFAVSGAAGAAAVNGKSSGMEFGVRHSF